MSSGVKGSTMNHNKFVVVVVVVLGAVALQTYLVQGHGPFITNGIRHHHRYNTFAQLNSVLQHSEDSSILLSNRKSARRPTTMTMTQQLLEQLRGGSTAATDQDDDDEEQDQNILSTANKKPKSKKSKKTKTTLTSSKSTTSATFTTAKTTSNNKPTQADLSIAILGGSTSRNSMQVVTYPTTTTTSGDSEANEQGHSLVALSAETLEAMGLFEGDTVKIKGKRGKSTVATVAMVSAIDLHQLGATVAAAKAAAKQLSSKSNKNKKTTTQSSSQDEQQPQQHYIGMSSDAMKNAGVRVGDKVTVVAAPQIKFGKAILILPFADTLPKHFLTQAAPATTATTTTTDKTNKKKNKDKKEQDEEEDAASPWSIRLFEEYLKPYFQGKFRPLARGDNFHIDGPDGRIEFHCVELDSVEVDGDSSCVVVDDTVIECDGEPLNRDDFRDDLDNAGYDTIGGASRHLAAVRELVELPLRHPELWRKLGINPPRGVLLTGPPGSGKTAMARAVAAETGAYFFVINGPEVISKRAGESETNLRRAFEDAEANAEDYNGAILFIDEIDSIAPKREKAGGEVEKRIVSQLLTLMDGMKPTSKVVVMAATNRPTVLEPALRRPGRFDRELDLGIPDEAGRLEILQIKTRDMRLGADVDLELLARNTHGYVGADLQQLCMEAALECIRGKMGLIDFDQDCVDKKILDSIVVEGRHFDHALGIVHPSSLRENQVEIPDVHWEDVGGLEDVKRELHETVQYPIEHADKFVKFGMSPSKGVLFYGPPGCGKTLLAKAIANECGANFISIKGPELLTQWFGESEANVRELFDKARAASPCILMFDEMDSIAKTRGGGNAGSSEAGDRVLNQILTEIDGVGARKNVFVIGATNRPDILDPAVIRPGRLDQLIYIPLPDLKSRTAIFKALLRKAPVDPAVDVEVLARSTHGFSGADIGEICTTASKLAIREAILAAEERQRRLDAGELDADDEEEDESTSTAIGNVMLITKRHFNFAMSKARRSVSEKDLALFDEFAEKQKSGRGEAASNFSFGDNDAGADMENDVTTGDDLYE